MYPAGKNPSDGNFRKTFSPDHAHQLYFLCYIYFKFRNESLISRELTFSDALAPSLSLCADLPYKSTLFRGLISCPCLGSSAPIVRHRLDEGK